MRNSPPFARSTRKREKRNGNSSLIPATAFIPLKVGKPPPGGRHFDHSFDVLFTGSREGYFVALDARSGAPLWKATLGGPMIMNPITYSVKGKQFVAVNAGNCLFVFGLR